MALHSLGSQMGSGGTGIPDKLRNVLTELQGFSVAVVAGAAAGTKMNIAALRAEDTLASVLAFNAGVPSEDVANCSIASTKAYGTITCATVVADDEVVVNGTTYVFKAAPVLRTEVALGVDNDATAANLAAAINAYESRYVDSVGGLVPQVVASVVDNVVTVTAAVDGAAGNAITLTSSDGGTLAVTGSGTLTNGTDTGGFTSTTNLSTQTVVVFWFNKR